MTPDFNYPLIGILTIFILLALIIMYYVFTYSNDNAVSVNQSHVTSTDTKSNNNTTATDKAGSPPNASVNSVVHTKLDGTKEVFNIAENIFSYDDAEPLCKAYGAELATFDQLDTAWKSGANWCNKGWIKSDADKPMAYFPVNKQYWDMLVKTGNILEQAGCLGVGVNGGIHNKSDMFGVNCYGVKPEAGPDDKIAGLPLSEAEFASQRKIADFKARVGKFNITSFNGTNWSQK